MIISIPYKLKEFKKVIKLYPVRKMYNMSKKKWITIFINDGLCTINAGIVGTRMNSFAEFQDYLKKHRGEISLTKLNLL